MPEPPPAKSGSARRSYRGLMALPAWGLYRGEKLIASVRARDAYDARDIFRVHRLTGERVRRI
jgi:hypothetical protein